MKHQIKNFKWKLRKLSIGLVSVMFLSTAILGTVKAENTVNQNVQVDAGVDINETNFPDENFRKYVKDNFDLNKDNKLTKQEQLNATWPATGARKQLQVNADVKDVKGIEYFTEIHEVWFYSKYVKNVDLSKLTKLKVFKGSKSALTSLDLSNCNILEEINFPDNKNLTEVKLPQTTTLKELDMNSCNISSIDLDKATALEKIQLGKNNFTTIDVSKNIAVKSLALYQDQNNPKDKLKTLDVTNNVNLEVLSIEGNKGLNPDISKNVKLKQYVITNNNIDKLDVSNNVDLESLHVYWNKNLKEIDLTNNSKLTALFAYYDGLEILKLPTNTEKELKLSIVGNHISHLDLPEKIVLKDDTDQYLGDKAIYKYNKDTKKYEIYLEQFVPKDKLDKIKTADGSNFYTYDKENHKFTSDSIDKDKTLKYSYDTKDKNNKSFTPSFFVTKNEIKNPTKLVVVDNLAQLEQKDKEKIIENVKKVNNFDDKTKVTVENDGLCLITFENGIVDKIDAKDVVREKTEAEKL